jgi:CheY-like chemotaxis protein
VEADPQMRSREIVVAISSDSLFYPFIEEGEAFCQFLIRRFRSGEEVLKSLTSEDSLLPDLIIASYDLPFMNGAAFVARCHQLPRIAKIPALILIPRGFDRVIIQRQNTVMPVDLIEIPDQGEEWSERVRRILGYWNIVLPKN